MTAAVALVAFAMGTTNWFGGPCGGAGVLPENAVVQWYNDSSEDTRGALFLNGFNQTVSSISSPVRAANVLGYAIGSDTVRNETLTLKARESNTSCCKLRGGVSLVYDPLDPSYVQTISNRIHTTSGGLVVKGGRLVFGGDTTTLAKAGYIRAEGGAFELHTAQAQALALLTNITVSSTGTLVIDAPDAFRVDHVLDLAPAGHAVVKVVPGGFAFKLYTLSAEDESMRIVGVADFTC